MLIGDVCSRCRLTRKAVEYYVERGLISPTVGENGYRDFSKEDAEKLERIAVLRSLGLSVSEIRAYLSGGEPAVLQKISAQKELEREVLRERQRLLQSLAQGSSWSEIRAEAEGLEKKQSILTRLLDRFPGYYGKYVACHFAPFLGEPIETEEQQQAFEAVVAFLDGLELVIPAELQKYLEGCLQGIEPDGLPEQTAAAVREAVSRPEQYLSDNRELLEQYLALMQSEAFRETPAYRLRELLKRLNEQNGYNDVFIPAMCRLSRAYGAYHESLLHANEVFLKSFPQAGE